MRRLVVMSGIGGQGIFGGRLSWGTPRSGTLGLPYTTPDIGARHEV